jgi:hypothetical protein
MWVQLLAMAKSTRARPNAQDVWRMEDTVAKTEDEVAKMNGAGGSCSMSFFALCLPRKVR